MIKTDNSYANFEWVQIIDAGDEEIKRVRNKYNLTCEMLKYATDDFESPRYDQYENNKMVILSGIEHKKNQPVRIQPIAFFIQDKPKRLITFSTQESSPMLVDLIERTPQSYKNSLLKDNVQPRDLILNSFYNLTANYLTALSEVEHKRNLLQNELSHKRNSEHLSELLEVKVDLIYFLNALEKNQATLNNFQSANKKNLNITESTYLRDIEIEMKQALDMANISTKIMNLLSDAYESIINNKTNRSMNILTVASIVLAIPSIVVGFFGMNVSLPGEREASTWLLIFGGTVIIMLLVYIMLKRHGFFN